MSNKEKDHRINLIAKRIKTLRIEAGYSSYEAFAVAHSLERKQYWRVEEGANLQLTTLFRVLDAHNMTLKKFFSGIEE